VELDATREVRVVDRQHACGMGFMIVSDAAGHRFILRDIASVFAGVHVGEVIVLGVVDYPAEAGGPQWAWGITQAFEVKGE
jgi:hypothetical protein